MRIHAWSWRTAMVGVIVLLVAAACESTGGGQQPAPAGSPTDEAGITVASFDFPESRLLAELYGQALASAGYPVEPAVELGSREVVEPALEQGLVDMVPEYAGSALNFLERRADAADADSARTYARLAEAAAARDLTAAAAAPAENQNAFAVRGTTALELDLRSVSDLAPVAGELVFGGPPECPERSTCLRGLREVYGVQFERFLAIDQTRNVVVALDAGEIDVGLLFTTDPALVEREFVALEDDQGIQPAENVVPLVRDAVVDRHGSGLIEALDGVSRDLTTAELAELNRRVQEDERSPRAVARQWLDEHEVTR